MSLDGSGSAVFETMAERGCDRRYFVLLQRKGLGDVTVSVFLQREIERATQGLRLFAWPVIT
jgi:hypothetical protein